MIINKSGWSLQQAEQFLIGQLLDKPEKLMDLEITVDHFSIETHRQIFRSIQTLETKNELIDVISVSQELEKLPGNDAWMATLGQYQMDSFSPSFFKSSQAVMLESYRKREVNKIINLLSEDFNVDKAIQSLMTIDHVEQKHLHTMAEAAMAASA